MNSADRRKLADMAAGWEWQQGGSVSEAMAFGQAARELITTMGLTDEDLSFARCWALAGALGIRDEEATVDALTDLMDEIGNTALIDLTEDRASFLERLRGRGEGQ